MEKLKNLLNPGGKHDDEILYGSGTNPDAVHSAKSEDTRGAGSHLASARDTIDVNPSSAKSGAATQGPATIDFEGNNPSQGQTETNAPITGQSGLAGSFADHGREGLSTSNADSQTSHGLLKPGISEDTSSATRTKEKIPDASQAAQPGSALESSGNFVADQTSNTVGSSVGRNAAVSGAGLATNEKARYHEVQHTTESRDTTDRAFPLGGTNAQLNQTGSQPRAFEEQRVTATKPTNSLTDSAGLDSQPGAPTAQSHKRDLERNMTNDTELSSYGPESWQHEHNKRGHEFVPVKQHETLMGALLDPHSSGREKDTRTEPQTNLKREAAISGAALAGAGAAWEGSQGHSAPSSGIPSGTIHDDEAHGRSGLDTEPTSAMAARSAVEDPIKHRERGQGRTAPQIDTSNSASDSADVALSGPIHRSSILNKLDPRIRETSPSTVANTSTSPPTTSTSLSGASPYSSSQLDPRVDSESRKETSRTQHYIGRDAVTVGALDGAALVGAGYAKEGDHEKPSLGQEAPTPVHNRGFMGFGDSGFDHDHAGLDPQRTSFAPPSAATQALRSASKSQVGSLSATSQPHASEYPHGHGTAIDGSSAATAEGIRASHNEQEPNLAIQPSSNSYQADPEPEPQHHFTSDAVVVGAGAGASGGLRHHQNHAEPMQEAQPTDITTGPDNKRNHHYGRDAAVVGTGALAAEEIHRKEETPQTEFSKQDAEHAKTIEKEQEKKAKALEKEQEKEAKSLEKEHKKEEKVIAAEQKKEEKALAHQQKEEAKHEEALAKEQKEHEKEAKAQEKQHKEEEKAAAKEKKEHEKEAKQLEKQHKREEKAIAKEEKEHAGREEELAAAAVATEKEDADHDGEFTHSKKEDKRHEKLHAALERAQIREDRQFEKAQKEHEKENTDTHGEKKHKGLLGLFHRDKKSSKDTEEEDLENRGHSSFDLTDAKPAEAGVVAPSAYELTEHEKQQHEKHERNRLHKDPPASLLPTSGNTTYAEPPKSGYATQVTGGTGTTALAQGDDFNRGSHISALGNKLDPAVDASGMTTNNKQNTIIDSHNGLPVDLSKAAYGHGTDDTPMPQEGMFPSGQTTHDQGRRAQAVDEEIGTAR